MTTNDHPPHCQTPLSAATGSLLLLKVSSTAQLYRGKMVKSHAAALLHLVLQHRVFIFVEVDDFRALEIRE